MPYKDPAKKKDAQQKYDAKYNEKKRKNALDSINTGEILDKHTWDMWCNEIKRGAKKNKRPYSEDFTNDIMFEMMTYGCYYCGQLATTLDRIDSSLDHTLDNCVASCNDCNVSKGTADSATFIRKAYYRARGYYYDDDTDIWFEKKQKPRMSEYKRKGVVFYLEKDDWKKLVEGDCAYCKRSPTTWFGVDRIVPTLGYVIENVTSCCWDCNNDKSYNNVDTTMRRNKRISDRVDNGELIISECEKVIIHNGTQNATKKVCVYGKVYENMSEASRAHEKSDGYVYKCIKDGRYPDDIFEIS
jgi:5-methylcytosine-specific restriction endonuclease McrA